MAILAIPLRDNPDIKKLLELMQASGYESERQGFLSILEYNDTLTEQYNNIMTELTDVKDKINDIADKKNPVSVMVEHLMDILNGIGEKLKALKDSILEFTKNTLDAAKDNGLSAVGAVAGTLHIHDGLEAISKSLGSAAAKVEHLENFRIERVESNDACHIRHMDKPEGRAVRQQRRKRRCGLRIRQRQAHDKTPL